MREIILVVEVKKPGIEVFTSHDVGGQIYDYLVGLLGTGTGIRPFGVLSTYDETWFAYLNDGGVSKEILERVTSQLESEIPIPVGRVLGNAEPQATSDNGSIYPASIYKLRRVLTGPKGSPTSDVSLETEEEEDDEDAQEDGHDDSLEIAVDDDDDDSEGDPTYNREVMYTPTFSGRDAIKGLILAVRCAIESLNVSEEKDIPFNGGGATGACACIGEYK
jgi:hypothetical protein